MCSDSAVAYRCLPLRAVTYVYHRYLPRLTVTDRCVPLQARFCVLKFHLLGFNNLLKMKKFRVYPPPIEPPTPTPTLLLLLLLLLLLPLKSTHSPLIPTFTPIWQLHLPKAVDGEVD